jgi:hypothetical protein
MVKKFAFLMMASFLLVAPALALQDTTAPAETPAAETPKDSEGKIPGGIKGILTGILGGAIAVFVGWGKNKNVASGEMEKFDIKHAWPTLIIGAIVGLIAHFMDLTPSGLIEAFETSPIFAGAVFALEAVWKMVFRHTAPLIRESVDAIKGAGKNPPSPPPPTP